MGAKSRETRCSFQESLPVKSHRTFSSSSSEFGQDMKYCLSEMLAKGPGGGWLPSACVMTTVTKIPDSQKEKQVFCTSHIVYAKGSGTMSHSYHLGDVYISL